MQVVIESGSRSWVQEVAVDAPVSIGRALGNVIVLEDTDASREHCVIERDDEAQHWLRDLESRNGTRLNGRFVKKALLRPGDRIEIGATAVTFTGVGAAAGQQAVALDEELRARVREPRGSLGTDALTGLSSFPALVQALREELAEPGSPLVLIKLDIDYLGLINDMFGLRVGDDVIRHAALILQKVSAEHPGRQLLCAREGGGKFAILWTSAGGGGEARALADEVRGALADQPLPGALVQASLTLSAGVAENPAGAGSWDALLRRAEAALAEAKRRGRDQVHVAPTQAEADEPSPRAVADAVRETRNSGIWAASGLWRPKAGPVDVLKAKPGEAERLAPLLTRSGQSILGLVAQALGSDLELTPLLELILSVLSETIGARRGYVLLRGEKGAFQLRAGFDRDAPGTRRQSAVSQGILREVERSGSALLVEDALEHALLSQRESVVAEGARSILAAPVSWDDELVGILYFDDKSRPQAFDATQRDLISACGSLIGGPIRRHAIHEARAHELQRTRVALARSAGAEKQAARRYTNIIGRSAAMGRLFSLLDRLAESHHPVLIHGESGTGKELVASAIHYNGSRADRPFVAENCAAFSETLLEAELFGHVKGSFTGADRNRVGLVEAAHGGTLFLDEIGEMSAAMQAKLLRVLQEGELRPVGGHEVRKVDVRLICASHRDLRKMVAEGQFREDLYYRVAVMSVDVPPLRERMEDIPLLIDHFLARACEEAGRKVPSVSREALQLLCHYQWQGNVRELENECKKLATLCPDEVSPADLSPKLLGDSVDRPNSALRKLAINEGADAFLLMIERGKSLAEVTEDIEKELIRRVLGATGGNRSETSRRMGLSRPGLLKKMKRYGIE